MARKKLIYSEEFSDYIDTMPKSYRERSHMDEYEMMYVGHIMSVCISQVKKKEFSKHYPEFKVPKKQVKEGFSHNSSIWYSMHILLFAQHNLASAYLHIACMLAEEKLPPYPLELSKEEREELLNKTESELLYEAFRQLVTPDGKVEEAPYRKALSLIELVFEKIGHDINVHIAGCMAFARRGYSMMPHF